MWWYTGLFVDVGTATQLELVQPLVPSAGPTCCLLGVLGPTYTVGGIRALRAELLQPSCNKDFIEARLDAVQELKESDTGLMTDLQVSWLLLYVSQNNFDYSLQLSQIIWKSRTY